MTLRRERYETVKIAPSRSLISRFWSYVTTSDNCWEWQGSKRNGYGRIWSDGKMVRAHRVSFVIHFGAIPNGLFVLHHCDNPGCVNPKHLFLGTQAENMKDCRDKGRSTGLMAFYGKGSECPSAKLTEEDVREIRRRNDTQDRIAKEFGVCQKTISNIMRRVNWKHVA